LHNGQPTGAQGPGTTETGAYTLNGATSNEDLLAVTRNPGATWFLPTENEWYKAAYYQPAALGGDLDSYWLYPMKTNSEPYSDQPPGTTPTNTRVGNFYKYDDAANGYDDGYAVTGSPNFSNFQNYLTNMGSYTSSPSFYGTFDQGGNVAEWNETGQRGGSWAFDSGRLQSSFSFIGRSAVNSDVDSGFRVASAIPEPSAFSLVAAALGLCTSRRRRRAQCDCRS
jgi:hypothetical protein